MRTLLSIAVAGLLVACAPTPDPAPAMPVAEAPPAATPVAEAPPEAPMPEPVITGGYAPANLEDEMAKAAQAVAVDAIYKRDPTRALVEKVEASVQVVAGLNYDFTITMTGGSRFGVTVFRGLDGKMEVTKYAKLP